LYAEQQVGFLAGYAAVYEGHRKIAFMGGMAVPAVVRYGQGFIYGADYAAKELGLTDVEIQYHYTGDFEANQKNQTTAATLYSQGTTIIFACGGAVGQSVMAAAANSENNGKVIGVDVDQSAESDTVITSATKGIGISAYRALESFFGGDWEAEVGGKSITLDAAKDGVGLVMGETARFEHFTKAQYDAIYDKLVKDEIDIPWDMEKAQNEDQLTVEKVKVYVVGETA
ncbi:MAG TPA: BMP family ABC transporter substrate-binding protein, partial [Bacilli bacterium]